MKFINVDRNFTSILKSQRSQSKEKPYKIGHFGSLRDLGVKVDMSISHIAVSLLIICHVTTTYEQRETTMAQKT